MRRRSGYEPTNRADGNLPVEHEDQPDTAAASHAGTRCGKPDRRHTAATNRTHCGTDKTEGTEEYHPLSRQLYREALEAQVGNPQSPVIKTTGQITEKDMERSETGIFSAAESQAKRNAAPGEAAAATGGDQRDRTGCGKKEEEESEEERHQRELEEEERRQGRARSAGRGEPEALGENRTRTQKDMRSNSSGGNAGKASAISSRIFWKQGKTLSRGNGTVSGIT